MAGLFAGGVSSAQRRTGDAGYAAVLLAKHAAAPESTYSLAGRLVLTPDGWGLLDLPNALVRGMFQALHEPGVELPLRDGELRAHVTVFRPEDVAQIGGGDKITERGRYFKFQLGPLQVVKPKGWAGVSACFLVRVFSPELKQLRKSYGLSPLPGANHEFHITIAVRKTGILRPNAKTKAAVGPPAAPAAFRKISTRPSHGLPPRGVAIARTTNARH